MSIKIAHKQSAAEVVSSVTAEMLRPRVAQSAKETGIKKEYAVPEVPAKRKAVPSRRVRRGPAQFFTSPAS
jgi:hypothetical protein